MGIIQRLKSPTPKKWRRLGNAILATGTAITAGTIIGYDTLDKIFTDNELKITMIIAFILGVAGKFITTLFTEEAPVI